MTKLPVVAAIPNYNMGEQLRTLLPQLLKAGYDEIYVLDDNSTDQSALITHSVDPGIHFVAGGVNKGAGANRNRIIKALHCDALIHFLDADTVLETEHSRDIISEIVPDQPFGFVGGLAKTTEGYQSVWNYGPRQSLWSALGAGVQGRMEPLITRDPQRAQKIREQYKNLLEDWPNPLETPIRRPVFWVLEQNFVVDSRVFATLGGFDERLREHEIQDLAIRMSKRGLDRFFDPSFAVTHQAVAVRGRHRELIKIRDEYKIAKKHGMRNWVFPDGRMKPKL